MAPQYIETGSGSSPLRWLMLVLTWSLYLSFGITAGSLALLVAPIVEDLGLTYGQMGFILGTWQLVYIGTATPLDVSQLGVEHAWCQVLGSQATLND